MFVTVATDGSPKPTARSPRPLAEVMERVVSTAGGWHVWRLRRKPEAAPDLLIWIDPASASRGAGLNVLWLASPTLGNDDAAREAAYAAAPKLHPRGAMNLRDVPHEPQSPRLAAVMRPPVPPVPGLLCKAGEATLFDGPAATARGIQARVDPDGDAASVRFEARDAEVIQVADPLPKPPPPPSSITCGVFLVKLFEDGSTLVVDRSIVPTERNS